MAIDLHMHSVYSAGGHDFPATIFRYAREKGRRTSMTRSICLVLICASVMAMPCCAAGEAGGGPGAPAPLSQQAAGVVGQPLRRLYVAPDGNDTNEGLSPDSPFRTIGRAAGKVKPGDLVLVSGGTYLEHIKLERAGTKQHPIIFRAAPFETAVVTFGDRLDGWRKAEGSRFCYSLAYPHLPNMVWEDSTVTRYVRVKDAQTLARLPGSFLYDAEAKVLHLHPLRGLSPEQAGIVVVRHSDYSFKRSTGLLHPTLRGFFSRTARLWDRGFEMCAPHNGVEGFTVAYQPTGIQMKTNDCRAVANTVYGCVAGIHILDGDRNLVAGNTCFRNDSHGILAQTWHDAVISNNVCRSNTPDGAFQGEDTGGLGNPHDLAYYGGNKAGHISFIGNLVISHHPGRVWRAKGLDGRITATHNVFVGGSPKGHFTKGGSTYAHNTVVGGALVDRHSKDRAVITSDRAREDRVIAQNLYLYSPEIRQRSGWWVAAGAYKRDAYPFADPRRDDYRLRPDSPDLGTGAHPDPAPVRYVSVEGSDEATGLTPKAAWRTLAKAAASVRPGQTVYVLPGTYTESITIAVQGTADKPVSLASYGHGQVVLDGGGRTDYGCVLKGAAHVTIDGVLFKGFGRAAVSMTGCRATTLARNVFDGARTGVHVADSRDVVLANNTFFHCGTGAELAAVEQKLVLRNNLFAGTAHAPVVLDKGSRARLVSENNGFAGRGAREWLAGWRSSVRETHPSRSVEVAVSGPAYRLPRGSMLAFAGLGHTPIGARGAVPDDRPVLVEELRAASLGPDRAVLAWTTPRDFPNVRLRWWGDDGKKGNTHLRQDRYLKSTDFTCRLRGLTPGATYNVRLTAYMPDGREGSAEASFTTPESVRPPGTLYVAVTGNDRNDGGERSRAFRTLSAAALAAVPGDRVRVGPGVYAETLEVWCSGLSADQRLVFESEEVGGAVIDCERLRPDAIRLDGVRYVMFDGFRIRGLIYAKSRAVHAQNVRDVVVRNMSIGAADFKGAGHLLVADNSRGLTITNNLFGSGWFHVKATRCADFAVVHNTFFHGGIGCLMLRGGKDASWRITDNIFLGRMHRTKDVAAVAVSPSAKPPVCDRNLYWQYRPKRDGPALFGMARDNGHGSRENARTIEEAVEKYGVERNGQYASPRFVRHEKGDFRLKPDSPAIGMGARGATVGTTLTVLLEEDR